MSRHQTRLLLCSLASVALIAGALFALDWFQIDFGPARISIDLQSLRMCTPDQGCKTTTLSAMTGIYPIVATVAFWAALPLMLLVLVQAGSKLVSGSANIRITQLGYLIGTVEFLAAIAAGYVFAPETDGTFEMMGGSLGHTVAPPLLMAGSLLAMLAARYALLDGADDAAEYKPIVVQKDGDERLPAPTVKAGSPGGHVPGPRDRIPTPGAFERIPLPGRSADGRVLTPPGPRDRVPTPGSFERIPLPGREGRVTTPPARERLPDSLDGSERPKSASQQPVGGRTRAPSDQPLVARTTSPGGRARNVSEQPLVARTTSTGARTRSPSEQPLVARASSQSGERTKSPSQPGERTKSPSQPGDRTKSPSQGGWDDRGTDPAMLQDLEMRARTSSSGPIDMAARLGAAPIAIAIKPPLPEAIPVPADQIPVAPESGLVIRKRTASAAPLSPQQIPAAARSMPPDPMLPSHGDLFADVVTPPQITISSPSADAMLSPSIRSQPTQPLPELQKAMSSQSTAPQAPRTKSPLSSLPMPGASLQSTPPTPPQAPEMASMPAQQAMSAEPSPEWPDSTSGAAISAARLPPLDTSARERSPSTPPPLLPSLGAHRKTPRGIAPPPKPPGRVEPRSASATGRTPPGAMPSITLRSLGDDIGDFDLSSTPLPPIMPNLDDEISGLGMSFEPTPLPVDRGLLGKPGVSATGSSPPGKLQPAFEPKIAHPIPPALRGKLKYAVTSISLTSVGINAVREDGTTKHVIWDTIVGVIARRLPAEAPYEGATFVDVVSLAGATLRILPWTHIDGAPVLGEDEERARAMVNLVAARCLEAKLDTWTKVFADGVGRAAQLPSTKTLAAHDERLA